MIDQRELKGEWRALPRGEELERNYWQSDRDDGDWPLVTVPSQWYSDPDIDAVSGPVAYRLHFETPSLDAGQRARIRANGVFYYAHYWVDDAYLGDRSGYFLPHEVETTEQLAAHSGSGDEHLLAIEVECPVQSDVTAKNLVTGVFSQWDAIGADFYPGGIWRPVELVTSGPVYISNAVCLVRQLSAASAQLDIRVGMNAREDETVQVTLRLARDGSGEIVSETTHDATLTAGDNENTFDLGVSNPELWWPRALGDQPLYRLEVSVTGADGRGYDRTSRLTGIRSIEVDNWQFTINGERMFIRSSNYAPTRRELAQVTRQDCERDIQLATDANLDMLRVHAHVATPELYECADRAGMMLWQDFPLQWDYSRRVKKPALSQARGMVDHLGSHASVAMWSCHNEPLAVEDTDVEEMTPWQAFKVGGSMMVPTWNKNVLDPALRKTIQDADPSRFVNEKSGELPNPISFGTDAHLYFGWYAGRMRALTGVGQLTPRLLQFVSEFGAQALPSMPVIEEMAPGAADAWPDIDWDDLRARFCAQHDILDKYVPRALSASLDAYRAATQEYQAELIRYYIETIRRVKYRPAGGYCHFQFNDSQPAITWSVLDDNRTPKTGYAALRAASADVIVVADYPAENYKPGAKITARLHVVNDTRHALRNLTLSAEIDAKAATDDDTAPAESGRVAFKGDVEADSVAGVGKFSARLPAVSGAYRLLLGLRDAAGNEVATNSYPIRIL